MAGARKPTSTATPTTVRCAITWTSTFPSTCPVSTADSAMGMVRNRLTIASGMSVYTETAAGDADATVKGSHRGRRTAPTRPTRVPPARRRACRRGRTRRATATPPARRPDTRSTDTDGRSEVASKHRERVASGWSGPVRVAADRHYVTAFVASSARDAGAVVCPVIEKNTSSRSGVWTLRTERVDAALVEPIHDRPASRACHRGGCRP